MQNSNEAFIGSLTMKRMGLVASEEESGGPDDGKAHFDMYKVSNVRIGMVPLGGWEAGKVMLSFPGFLGGKAIT